MKRMIDAKKFLDKLLYMGYMDEEKSEVEEVANNMTEDAYTKDEVVDMLKDLKRAIVYSYMDRNDKSIVEELIQQKIDTLNGKNEVMKNV